MKWASILTLALVASMVQAQQETIFERMEKAGWKLTRTLLGQDSQKAALFSHKQDYTGTNTSSIKFALIRRNGIMNRDNDEVGMNLFSIETNFGSSENTDNDAFRIRLGQRKYIYTNTESGIRGHIEYSAKFETDQNQRKDAVFLEVLLTPVDRKIGIGGFRFSGDDHDAETATNPYYIWLPRLIIEAGRAIDNFGTGSRDLSRYGGYIEITYYFPNVAKSMGLHNLSLSATGKALRMSKQDVRHREIWTADAEFSFTKNSAFTISYVNGHDSPTFGRDNSLSFSLGLKFGS